MPALTERSPAVRAAWHRWADQSLRAMACRDVPIYARGRDITRPTDDEPPNDRTARRARDARASAAYRTARAVVMVMAGQLGMVPRRPQVPMFDRGTYRRLIGKRSADGWRDLLHVLPDSWVAPRWYQDIAPGIAWRVEPPGDDDGGLLTPDEHRYYWHDVYTDRREHSRIMGDTLRAQRFDAITGDLLAAQSIDRRRHRELAAVLRERDAFLRSHDAHVPREDVVDRRSGLFIVRADRVALRSREPLTQTLADAETGKRRTRVVVPTRVIYSDRVTVDVHGHKRPIVTTTDEQGRTVWHCLTVLEGFDTTGARRGWVGHVPIRLAPSVRSLRAEARHRRSTIGAASRGPIKRDVWTLAERSLARRAADAPRATRDAAHAWVAGLPIGTSADTGYGPTITRHDRATYTVRRGDDIREARRIGATPLVHALAAAASA